MNVQEQKYIGELEIVMIITISIKGKKRIIHMHIYVCMYMFIFKSQRYTGGDFMFLYRFVPLAPALPVAADSCSRDDF